MLKNEKAELLRSSIEYLYCKEGRSKSYIARVLDIDRHIIRNKIKEWNLIPAEPRRHLTPSNQKFFNKNKQLIKSRLKNDETITDIAKELKIDRRLLLAMIQSDKNIYQEYLNWKARTENRHKDYVEHCKSVSSRCYEYENLLDEQWKPILGFPNYEVSNYGRIRAYAKRYKSYYLISLHENPVCDGRIYVMLYNKNKRKNLSVARIVAHGFVEGYSENNNTVNHKDGNVKNNKTSNLEWVSQAENNLHSYQQLNRVKNHGKRYEFDKILYKGKYEFKTIAAFARFLGKSETQVRRYMDEPDKHDIVIVTTKM